ncbi:Hypothetical protein CINCED_3A004236 [Cinara cedri]|nr:Hypothetical protein CINCED_3A004236 [Cinara cedri]
MERVHIRKQRMKDEDDLKTSRRQAQHIEMIVGADRKFVYNQIKRMVEIEMKANEHLFLEDRPKPELKVEKEIEQPKITKEELLEKLAEIKKKKDEEERKLVEEKRLQLFIENSEELRIATMDKRRREIGLLNYKIIQEKERFIKKQKTENRELSNLQNSEIFKNQALEREEEKRKNCEKKQRYQQELYEQLQEKEAIRKHEKELKIIECNEYKKLNETLKEEDALEKLDRIKKQVQKREEIKQFTEERSKWFSESHKALKSFGETKEIIIQNLKDNMEDKFSAKIQLTHENEKFKKHQAIIKEERRKLSEAITNKVMQQIREIEELKQSIERQNAEVRRKRTEAGNKALIEQIKSHAIMLEEQKVMKYKIFEEAQKEYEEYLKEEKLLRENKNRTKQQVRTELNEQMKYNKYIIENQRKIEMEDHQTCMKEIDKHDKLLKKLLNELWTV